MIPPGGGNSVLSNVFNGSFAIDQIVSSTRLRFTLLSAPDGTLTSPIGAISIGVAFHALGAGGGTGAVIEDNRVYGARFGNYLDTFSNKDITVRNNYFSDVVCGVYYSLGLASQTPNPVAFSTSITQNGNIATFTTATTHGLLPKSAVLVQDATIDGNSPPANTYNGYYEVLDVPTSTTFRYQMGSPPGKDADTNTGDYEEYWRVRRLVVENNVIELTPSLPLGFAPSTGFRRASNSSFAGIVMPSTAETVAASAIDRSRAARPI